jgi:hypothetical protein
MPNLGQVFRDAIIEEIREWQIPDLHLYREIVVGSRFVGKKRKLDIVLQYDTRFLGIEAKYQATQGTAYQKLSYALEDARKTPIPTIIVFAGEGIEEDVKAQLISSGIGLEVTWSAENGFHSGVDILKQRILIELGLDWLSEQAEKRVF